MSITQFANSIRSSETTVQLLKDELRKEHETAAKPDGDILRGMNVYAVLRAAIVDTLKERNERRLAISVDSDVVSFSVYIDADGKEGDPKDVLRQLAEYIGCIPKHCMGSMIANVLASM